VSEGVDFAAPGPTPAGIVAAGKSFVGRYLSDHAGDPFGLSASEAASYHAAGLDIVLLWEIGADRAAGGAAAGKADATGAKAQLTALGAPDGVTVYFVCQDDGTPPPIASILAYLDAAAAVLGPSNVGAYAGGTVLAKIHAARPRYRLWRAAATSWGAAPAGTALIQHATGSTSPPAPPIDGHAVDLDRATVAEFGQWRATDVAGIAIALDSTASPSTPWTSFGTAVTKVACRSNDVATRAQTNFPAGAALNVVETGTLKEALGGWPAGTPIVVCNLNGRQNLWIADEVTFSPLHPPVPPVQPTKTVTVTGQNVTVTGPK
jgi:hypothetical protein